MDAPNLGAFLEHVEVVISVHGYGREGWWTRLLVGGANRELAARAGYNPQAAVSLWQKMEKVAGGNEPPKFLSTHPPSADRIADLQNQIQKVMPLYQQAKAGGTAAAGK